MAVFKKAIAFVLILTIFISMGEGLALASPGLAEIPLPEEEKQAPPEAEPVDGDDGLLAPPEAEETVQPGPSAQPEQEVQPEPDQEPEQTPDPEQSTEPEPSPEPEQPAQDDPETAAVQPEHKQWPWTEPGNTVVELMNGGRSLLTGDRFYFTEDGLWLEQSGVRTLLADVYAENLNLVGQWLYYTVDDTVYRMPASGGAAEAVYTAVTYIWQMYVMGDELRMVVDGGVYSYDMTSGALETLTVPGHVMRLIPTPYGNLYLTGELFNYTLWAENTQLLTGVDSAYPEDGWLIVVNSSGTWQTAMEPLFAGSISLAAYSLHAGESSGVSDEQAAANEAAYLESEEYLAMQAVLQEYNDNGIATISTSTVLNKTLTPNQQNIVLRAQQMSEVKWKCLKTIYSWGGNNDSYVSANASWGSKVTATDGSVTYGYFQEGKTYKGVPYSQAVSTGYVGWEISLKKFLEATQNSKSVFYTDYSKISRWAPYYGSDCSGFVSYAWDLPYRCACSSLLTFSEPIGSPDSQGLYKLQVGDCLNLTTEHVVLITDIGYNSKGEVVAVEITEQTPPKMRVTCYAKDGDYISGKSYDYTGQLSYLSSYYLNKGYKIYRRNCSSRPNVREPGDDAGLSYAAAPTMKVEAQGPASAKVTLSHADKNAVIYYTTDGSAPSFSSTKYTGAFTVTRSTTIRAVAKVPGYENGFPLNETLDMATQPSLKAVGSQNGSGLFLSNGVYYADPSGKLTLEGLNGSTVYYTTDGSTPSIKSSKVTSSTAIAVKDGMTIKAFAVAASGVPSSVASFGVKSGKLYTITVDDPYGFISPTGSASVLEGGTVTFKIGSTNGYTLGNVKVDGKSLGAVKEYTFSKVDANHTIKAEVKLPFTDVSSSAWYVDAVAFAANKGIFNGTSSTRFEPETAMNRAMFITVLGRYAKVSSTIANWSGQMGLTNGTDIYVRSSTTTSSGQVTIIAAFGQYIKVKGTVPASQSKDGAVWYQVEYNGKNGYVRSVMPSNNKTLMYVCPFTDLGGSSVSYCNGYAQWANLNGIVNGTSSTSFSPSAAISRQDICVVLYNYLKDYLGKSLPAGSNSFKDSSQVSSYAAAAVRSMAAIGVITGDNNGNVNPTAAATRAEVAAIFMRLDKYLNG